MGASRSIIEQRPTWQRRAGRLNERSDDDHALVLDERAQRGPRWSSPRQDDRAARFTHTGLRWCQSAALDHPSFRPFRWPWNGALTRIFHTPSAGTIGRVGLARHLQGAAREDWAGFTSGDCNSPLFRQPKPPSAGAWPSRLLTAIEINRSDLNRELDELRSQ
jgi:hypothetical protein